MKPEGIEIGFEKKAVLQNIEELVIVENRKDIDGILDLVTEDILFVFQDTIIDGQKAVKEMLEEAVKHFISSKHIPLHVEVSASGDMAWLIGYEINQRQKGDDVVDTKQNYIIAFRKVEGKWKQAAICVT